MIHETSLFQWFEMERKESVFSSFFRNERIVFRAYQKKSEKKRFHDFWRKKKEFGESVCNGGEKKQRRRQLQKVANFYEFAGKKYIKKCTSWNDKKTAVFFFCFSFFWETEKMLQRGRRWENGRGVTMVAEKKVSCKISCGFSCVVTMKRNYGNYSEIWFFGRFKCSDF